MTKKISLGIWLAGTAWIVFALALARADRAGATIGGISGLVSLIGGTAGAIALCIDGQGADGQGESESEKEA